MKSGFKPRPGRPEPAKDRPVPPIARKLNTAIAIILIAIGLYHLTQPNQAWRSGCSELLGAILLLAAAHLVSLTKAFVIDLIVAAGISFLGIRHLIQGGGWISGTTELTFAALLILSAAITFRARRHSG